MNVVPKTVAKQWIPSIRGTNIYQRRSSIKNDSVLEFSVIQTMKAEVFTRDGFECVACHWSPPGLVVDHYNAVMMGMRLPEVVVDPDPRIKQARKLTLDHAMPKSLGGGYVLENLQCMCSICNGAKSSSFNPKVKPKWLRDQRKFYNKTSLINPGEFNLLHAVKLMETKERIQSAQECVERELLQRKESRSLAWTLKRAFRKFFRREKEKWISKT